MVVEDRAYTCQGDIARSKMIGALFVSRYHRLMLLAPDIVKAILDERQSATADDERVAEGLPG